MTHQQCSCIFTFSKYLLMVFERFGKKIKIFLFKWDRYECMDGFLKVFLGLSAILDSVCVSSWEMTIICRLTIPYITIQLHFHQRTYICIKLYAILHWCAESGHCPPRPISIRDQSCKNYGNVTKMDQTLPYFDISMKRPFWIWSVQDLLAVSFQNDQKAWLWLTMMWTASSIWKERRPEKSARANWVARHSKENLDQIWNETLALCVRLLSKNTHRQFQNHNSKLDPKTKWICLQKAWSSSSQSKVEEAAITSL